MPNALLRKKVVVLALMIFAAAGIAVLLISGGKAGSARASAFSKYPALESNSVPGLTIAATPQQAATSNGPAYAANVPDEAVAVHRPIAGTIRALEAASPALSLWIARNPEGGICVLASRRPSAPNERPPLAYSCSKSDAVQNGATLELAATDPSSNKVLYAGIVPAGVASVTVRLDGGSSLTAPAHDGAWSAEADERAQAFSWGYDGTDHETVEGR